MGGTFPSLVAVTRYSSPCEGIVLQRSDCLFLPISGFLSELEKEEEGIKSEKQGGTLAKRRIRWL